MRYQRFAEGSSALTSVADRATRLVRSGMSSTRCSIWLQDIELKKLQEHWSAGPTHDANQHANCHRSRKRTHWIAARHAFELTGEGLRLIAGRGRQLAAAI